MLGIPRYDKIFQNITDYIDKFNLDAFWEKLKSLITSLGKEGIYQLLLLFYTMQRPDIPAKIKAIILGALGYFILPTDAVPDFIPVLGYSDDLAIVAICVAYVRSWTTPAEEEKAKEKMREWGITV